MRHGCDSNGEGIEVKDVLQWGWNLERSVPGQARTSDDNPDHVAGLIETSGGRDRHYFNIFPAVCGGHGSQARV